jgi:hypothetical protein
MQATDSMNFAALAADFQDWYVWRSRDSRGRESDWNATRRKMPRPVPPGIARRVTAADAAGLRGLLEQQRAEELALTAA